MYRRAHRCGPSVCSTSSAEIEEIAARRVQGLRSLAYTKDAATKERVARKLGLQLKESMSFVNTMILKYNMTAPTGYQKVFIPFSIPRELESLETLITNK